MGNQRLNVLFVCSGNICRSPLAAALLEKQLRALGIDDVYVESAGTMNLEGRGASRWALEVAADNGLDLGHHVSRQVNRTMLEDADIVVAMTNAHAEYVAAVLPGVSKRTIVLEVPDPYGLQKQTYETALAVIEDAMPLIIDKVRKTLGE
jgi:protein-tyrosine phosphatase